eukprot:7423462-Pyramimonas_sp.AAC.1
MVPDLQCKHEKPLIYLPVNPDDVHDGEACTWETCLCGKCYWYSKFRALLPGGKAASHLLDSSGGFIWTFQGQNLLSGGGGRHSPTKGANV